MARVQVTFDGVSSGAKRAAEQTRASIRSVGNAADSEGKRVSLFGSRTTSSFGAATKASHTLRNAFGLMLGAAGIGGVIVGLKSVAQAAIKQETIHAALRTQLDKSGISFAKFAGQIHDVIEAQSKLSAFDDEDLAQSFTAIVRITGDVSKALTLNALAADVARGRHIDLQSAAQLVGKVYGGNIGILARYGIQLAKGTTATEALAELQRRFAGQAETYGKTTQGSFDRAGVAIENVKESLGKGLLPVLTRAANALSEWANDPKIQAALTRWGNLIAGKIANGLAAIGKWVGDNRTQISSFFQGAAKAAQELAGAVASIVRGVTRVKESLGVSWTTVMEAAFGAVMLSKVLKLRAALVGAAGAGGAGSLLGALRLLTVSPWIIPIVGLITYNAVSGSPEQLAKGFGEPTGVSPDGKKIYTKDGKQYVVGKGPGQITVRSGGGGPTTVVPYLGPKLGPAQSERGQATLTAPTSWTDPGAGHAGGQTSGLPLGRTAGPKDMFFAEAGTTIGAPEDGTVVRIGSAQGGQSIYFKADSGPTYWLGHIVATVKVGTHVKKGQTIAKLYGARGFTTHLHIDKTGANINVPAAAPAGFDQSVVAPDKPGTKTTEKKGPEKADPKEAAKARQGLKTVLSRLNDVQSSKVRVALKKRLGWITTDLAAADTEDELSAVTERVGKLKDRLYDVIGAQSDRQKKAAEKLRERMKESVRKAVEAAADEVKRKRDVYAKAFELLAGKAMSVFDAKTQQMLGRARVSLFGVSLGVGDETPAERALRELRASRAAADLARSRADALANATPEEAAALRAQHALDDQEAALEQQAAAERKAADDALDAERARIQDERDAIKERFAARLAEIKTGFDNETITAKTAQEQMLALLRSYGVDYAEAGGLLGSAFATSLQTAISAASVGALLAPAGRVNPAGEVPAGSLHGVLSQWNPARHFAHGGKVPGVYIGRDSVPAVLSPGEYVLNRAQTAAMEAGRLGLGGSPQISFGDIHISGVKDGREAARQFLSALEASDWTAMWRQLEPESRRLINLQADR